MPDGNEETPSNTLGIWLPGRQREVPFWHLLLFAVTGKSLFGIWCCLQSAGSQCLVAGVVCCHREVSVWLLVLFVVTGKSLLVCGAVCRHREVPFWLRELIAVTGKSMTHPAKSPSRFPSHREVLLCVDFTVGHREVTLWCKRDASSGRDDG